MAVFHRIINYGIALPVGVSCLVNIFNLPPIQVYALVSDCSRVCLNGGSLDEGNCTCACVDVYSGDNCESKSILL